MKLGICGVTGSGKTLLANRLGKELNLPVIHFDEFFTEPVVVDGSITSYEEACSYDTDKLIFALRKVPYCIVEGFLLYLDPLVVKILDKRVFLDISDECVIQRRVGRQDRSTDNEEYLRKVTIPACHRNNPFQKKQAHIVINAEEPPEVVYTRVREFIRNGQ